MSVVNLDQSATRALQILYNSNNGVCFDALNIDDETYCLLVDNKYISEPEGRIYNLANHDRRISHKGTVIITPVGKGYVEQYNSQRSERRKASMRYWITTIIALIALLKSFSPELISLFNWIPKLLTQQ